MKLEKDVARLAGVLKSVNDLIALGIMQELTDKPNIYVFKNILLGKDKKYMKNWCENILTVWAHTFKSTNASFVELNVFDKESGDFICSYSVKDGLKI